MAWSAPDGQQSGRAAGYYSSMAPHPAGCIAKDQNSLLLQLPLLVRMAHVRM